MKIVIDNNVILDVFQNREPFVKSSSKVLRLVETKQIRGYITANSVTDIYYVLNRGLKNKQKLYSIMEILLKLVDIIDVTARDIYKAFHPEVIDFEDELIYVCAERANIDYIITRNKKDFTNSTITVITPEEFLTSFFKKF
ncbi:PIN domain-containing protein [Iocasia frigidifontis]|uniref:PIN domain-containing protein n=1 Tax=Iocasia fonsfrigidae TaxID=2682810 RepID=A0A8A7KPM0_9FIRM|nr:PIN domain-containing protein [Iocasia fonsfrigidae]QTL99752.1 PIN domain-containing protein [Iocasia fonsfrigidae]